MRSRNLLWIVAALTLTAVAVTALVVTAQPGPPPGAPGIPGGNLGGQPGGRPGMGMMPMMMPPAIAVANGKVYVVFMGTLFKFNAETLEEEAQAPLRPQGHPGMGPGGPGGPPPAPPGNP